MPEGAAVQSMFGRIASRYDLANRILSGGFDLYWRRVLTRLVQKQQPSQLADLATGSGDVAFALRKRLGSNATITGYDFCAPMLEQAILKRDQDPRFSGMDFLQADCLNLPMQDQSLDALTISFGLRNLQDRHRGLTEMHRVLKPGGCLYCLEFTQPTAWMKPFYFFYLKFILPVLARVVTGDKAAYDYLAGSIESFPRKEDIALEMRNAGFNPVHSHSLTGSIVAIHVAVKPT